MLVCVVWVRLLRGCRAGATLYMTAVARTDRPVTGLGHARSGQPVRFCVSHERTCEINSISIVLILLSFANDREFTIFNFFGSPIARAGDAGY